MDEEKKATECLQFKKTTEPNDHESVVTSDRWRWHFFDFVLEDEPRGRFTGLETPLEPAR